MWLDRASRRGQMRMMLIVFDSSWISTIAAYFNTQKASVIVKRILSYINRNTHCLYHWLLSIGTGTERQNIRYKSDPGIPPDLYVHCIFSNLQTSSFIRKLSSTSLRNNNITVGAGEHLNFTSTVRTPWFHVEKKRKESKKAKKLAFKKPEGLVS